MNEIELTTRRIIDNYICYTRRPFTIKDIVEMTEENENTVGGYIRVLKHEGKIKIVGKDGPYKLYVEVPAAERKKQPKWYPTDEEYERTLKLAHESGIL